jgi:hypothetical protein
MNPSATRIIYGDRISIFFISIIFSVGPGQAASAGQNLVFDPQNFFWRSDTFSKGVRARSEASRRRALERAKRVRGSGVRREGVERERGFEPPTFGMASRRSAAKLLPQSIFANSLNPSFNFTSKLSATHG